MKNSRQRKAPKMEKMTDCNIRKLYAGLVAVMIVAASITLSFGQPFINGCALLISAIILATISLRYREIELIWKTCKLHLKRK